MQEHDNISPLDQMRFWSKVDRSNGPLFCWEWTAGKHARGYGWIRWDGYPTLAHRIAWILTNGPIPKDLDVCHRCDNRACCNPNHFFLGTNGDNNHDRTTKGRSAARSRHGRSKLTEKDVAELRLQFMTGQVTKLQLSRIYGVSDSQIGRIVRSKNW